MDASVILQNLFAFKEREPATPKQIRYLYYLGYRGEVGNLSKPAASRSIAQIKEQEQLAEADPC